jgi:hypothetical protein
LGLVAMENQGRTGAKAVDVVIVVLAKDSRLPRRDDAGEGQVSTAAWPGKQAECMEYTSCGSLSSAAICSGDRVKNSTTEEFGIAVGDPYGQ